MAIGKALTAGELMRRLSALPCDTVIVVAVRASSGNEYESPVIAELQKMGYDGTYFDRTEKAMITDVFRIE
jgi:hypothetical protein